MEVQRFFGRDTLFERKDARPVTPSLHVRIDGAGIDPVETKTPAAIDPSTEGAYAAIAIGSARDVDGVRRAAAEEPRGRMPEGPGQSSAQVQLPPK